MSSFFWTSSHLGWGIFALLVFTALWWLLTDLVWRLMNVRIQRLIAMMAGGWIVGVGLVVTGSRVFGG
jgi:hypothetical protein